MDRDILLKNIVQILHENWADSTDKETAYLILDKVDEYIDKKAKRGEAFEKIVEGFKEIFYTNPHNWVTKEYYADEIKKLEQKYLVN